MEEIKIIEMTDLQEAINLVNEVFKEFVAIDYSEEGKQTFYNFVDNKYKELAWDLNRGHKKMWCCYLDGRIVGVVATRNISHLSLLFVAKEYQKKGIGKALFQTVKQAIRAQNFHKITVNSSPYAVPIYEHLGFVATNSEQIQNGMRYTPMEYSMD